MSKGASASQTGPSPCGSSRQGVSPVPASVPCAGTIGLIPHAYLSVGFEVVRVVKAGPLGKMWEVEQYGRAWLSKPASWERPRRRKVTQFFALAPDCDVAFVDVTVRGLDDRMREEIKAAEQSFRDAVRAIAMETRRAETVEQGSVAKP